MKTSKSDIEKQAKQILDKFADALEKAKIKESESYVNREEFERVEGKGECCENGFKKRVLENSPNHDDDFIIAEKGEWK